tara:strand:+ start:1209 stop:1658 length:450 start_codon:yes stop_codon:yes gene_type:complete
MKKFIIYGGVAVGLYFLYNHSKKRGSGKKPLKITPEPEYLELNKPLPRPSVNDIVIVPQKPLIKPSTFDVKHDISYLTKPVNKDRISPLASSWADLKLDARRPDGGLATDYKQKVAEANVIIKNFAKEGYTKLKTVYKNNRIVDIIPTR